MQDNSLVNKAQSFTTSLHNSHHSIGDRCFGLRLPSKHKQNSQTTRKEKPLDVTLDYKEGARRLHKLILLLINSQYSSFMSRMLTCSTSHQFWLVTMGFVPLSSGSTFEAHTKSDNTTMMTIVSLYKYNSVIVQVQQHILSVSPLLCQVYYNDFHVR